MPLPSPASPPPQSPALARATPLRYLDLGGCTLRPEGSAALAAALAAAAPSALEVLVLSRNELGDAGAGSRVPALPRLARLRRLLLAGNCIGPAAAAALAAALPAALEELDVSRNFVGAEGFGPAGLLGPLGRLPALRRLLVDGNGLGPTSTAVKDAIRVRALEEGSAGPALASADCCPSSPCPAARRLPSPRSGGRACLRGARREGCEGVDLRLRALPGHVPGAQWWCRGGKQLESPDIKRGPPSHRISCRSAVSRRLPAFCKDGDRKGRP